MNISLNNVSNIRGEINIPPDKSLSHRAVMFNSIANGDAKITNFLMGEDCLSTIDVLRKLGVKIKVDGSNVYTYGKGLHSLKKPSEVLYVGNSGTTIRLMSGILAGRNFESILDGDSSIRKRPMKRIIDPLTMMGAKISAENNNENAPFIFDYISDEDLEHFNQLIKILKAMNIPFYHDKKLVRDLDRFFWQH